MSLPDHERLTELFARYLELEPAEREQFLDRECGSEPAVRNELLSLAGYHESPVSIAKTGAAAERGLAAVDADPPQVGPYRVIDRIGAGGMGVVYRAQQEQPINRTVAVKLIRMGIESRTVIQRFESERQALALMNHPHVARVIDAGTTGDGRPFFAMEYVDGLPITEYVERNGFGLAGRLDLFMQLCDGVQHAHHNAIIHRDLKPSNVLVTDQQEGPVTKIIDFGVAKAIGNLSTLPPGVTEIGALIGTPNYMSPEQAGREGRGVDSRTDVYSLGVLLYELLTGCRPHDRDTGDDPGWDRLRERIRDEDPAPPSSRSAGLSIPRDLDWIALKALEKEPERRYASAAELSSDIERFLRDQPVAAGPPGAGYRLRKFLWRRRWAVGVTAALLGGLSLTLATAIVQGRAVAREQHRADRGSEQVTQLSGFLETMFEEKGVASRYDRSTPEQMLSVASNKMRDELADQPLLRARLLRTAGDVWRRAGRADEARLYLEQAHARLTEQLGPEDPETLAALNSLARLHRDQSQIERARALYEELHATRVRVMGRDHVDTLRTLSSLSFVHKRMGAHESAEAGFAEAAAGFERQLGREDPDTLITVGFHCGTLLEFGRYAEVAERLTDVLPQMQTVLGPQHLETEAARYNLACAHANLGREDQALRLLAEAIEDGFVVGAPLHEDPHLGSLHGRPGFDELARRAWLNTLHSRRLTRDRALLHESLGRADQATALFEELLETKRRLGEDRDDEAIGYTTTLARLYLWQRRFDDALPVFEGLSETLSERYHDDHYDILMVRLDMARCYFGRGDRDAALALALPVLEQLNRQTPEHTRGFAHLQAVRLALEGDVETAAWWIEQAAARGFEDSAYLTGDPFLAPLVGHPSYRAAIRQIRDRYREPYGVRRPARQISGE